jgi:succinylarginine dihydrolase
LAVAAAREHNFDGLVGPTHNYAGLSRGNLASMGHEGQPSSPRRAALEGLAKMHFVASLGVGQAVLPPHDRPSLGTLRRLGFCGTDEAILAAAAGESPLLLRMVSSAAAMWTANAATVAPSSDTADGRVHLVAANLAEHAHRAIEPDLTERILSTIFRDPRRFCVHPALPASRTFADEGAANHTRLCCDGEPGVHLFAWGRTVWGDAPAPSRFIARQTREASRGVSRLLAIDPARTVFAQQHPRAIDHGAFHSDVLSVGTGSLLLMHELAFSDAPAVLGELRARLGGPLSVEIATERELPLDDAVQSYVFNSQLLALDDGSMILLLPEESRENAAARAFVDRVLSGAGPLRRAEHFALRQSMRNGGGPACLRLRVTLTDEEAAAVLPGVKLTLELHDRLVSWVERRYRDRLVPDDLADPALMRESMTALDELTQILGLGALYDFQK